MNDFVSDYLAPGMALAGMGVTGYGAYKGFSMEALRRPWRSQEAIRSHYGNFGAEVMRQRVAHFGSIRSGLASNEPINKIRGLLEATVPPPDMVTQGGQNIGAGMGMGSVWREPKYDRTNMGMAWRIAHERMGLQPGNINEMVSHPLIGGIFPGPNIDASGVGAYLKQQPELAEEFLTQLNKFSRSQLVPQEMSPHVAAAAAIEYSPWEKATGMTSARLEQMGAGAGRGDLSTAINQLAGTMGSNTRIAFGSSPDMPGQAFRIRLESNKAAMELPILLHLQGRPTMLHGKYGQMRVTPMKVATDWETARYTRQVRNAVAGGHSAMSVGLPPEHALDVFYMRDLSERMARDELGFSPQQVEDSVTRYLRATTNEVFEGNDYLSGRGRDFVEGIRGEEIRSRVKIMQTDPDFRPPEGRGLVFNRREYVDAMAMAGFDANLNPAAMEKYTFRSSSAPYNWSELSTLGEYTQPRPDQLSRELRVAAGNIERLSNFDLQARAQSKLRYSIGKQVGDPLLNLRVATGMEAAWTELATNRGVGAHLRNLGAEEFIGASGMRKFRTERAAPGFIIDPSRGASAKFQELTAWMAHDKGLSDALVNGTINEYIAATDAAAPGQGRYIRDLLTFQQGQEIGIDEARNIVKAGNYGETFHMTGMKQVELKGGGMGYFVSGTERYGLTPGYKFTGTRTGKKTIKGFLDGSHKNFREMAAQYTALSEWMVGQGMEATDRAGAARGMGELFTKKGRFKSKSLGKHYMARAAGVGFLTTEGAKAVGGTYASEFGHSLANEVALRMEKNIRPVGFQGNWAAAKGAAAGHMRAADFEQIGDRWLRGGDSNFVSRRNDVVRAAAALGIVDLDQVRGGMRALESADVGIATKAWGDLSDRYGGIGIYNVEAAPQGTQQMIGGGGIATANQQVIEAFRMQGAGEIADELMHAVSGKAGQLNDLFGMASVLTGSVPETVVPLSKLNLPDMNSPSGIFSLDPATRRTAWSNLGVTPGSDFGIDLGAEVEIAGRKTRYVRPGQTMTGYVGGLALEDRNILKGIDSRLLGFLHRAQRGARSGDPRDLAKVAEAGEAYFQSIADATIGKGKAAKTAFKGDVMDSAYLQYQSAFDAPLGQNTVLEGHYIAQETAIKRFALDTAETQAWMKGGTAGRVIKGEIYGTIWRQPMEGLYRAATTKFLNAHRLAKHEATIHDIKGRLGNITDSQIFADETYRAAMGGDFDADHVAIHAIDPKNVRARAISEGLVETQVQLRRGASHDDIRGMLRGMHAEHGARGWERMAEAEFVDKAFNLGFAQQEYHKLQAGFSDLLKAPGESAFTNPASFLPGSEAFRTRMMEKYTAAELEKQVVGHISNTARTAFTAFTRENLGDPKRMGDAGMLLGNLVERVIKAKHLPEEMRAQGSEVAQEAIDILRTGDMTRSGRFKEILGGIFSPEHAKDKVAAQGVLDRVMGVSDDILSSVSRYREANPDLFLEQAISRQRGNIGDVLEAMRHAEAGSDHPLAALWAGMNPEKAASRKSLMWRNLRTNANQVFDLVNKNKKGALVGIGGAIAATMLFGSPGRLNSGQDALQEAAEHHGGSGNPTIPPPEFQATSRLSAGTRTDVRGIANSRLNSYNMAQNLSGLLGSGNNVNVRVRDHRSHVDEDYIMKRMGI